MARNNSIALLRPSIEKHLPSSREEGFKTFPDYSPERQARSETYALGLGMAYVSGPEAFGFTENVTTISDVRRALSKAQQLLRDLAGEHRMQLSYELWKGKRAQGAERLSKLENELWMASLHASNRAKGEEPGRVTPHEVARQLRGREDLTLREAELVSENLTGRSVFEKFEISLTSIIATLILMEREHRLKERASRKRNWRAAAVADKCRLVWARENYEVNSVAWQKFCSDEARHASDLERIHGFAPKYEKNDAPGPFGRFLRDILEVLDVRADDGSPVSAKTALASWRNVGVQQTGKS